MDDVARSLYRWQATGISSSPVNRVLALGDVGLWRRVGSGVPESDEMCLSDIDQLTAGTLAKINPDLVLSPVVTARFDCLDVAHVLIALGYSRSYRAVARSLPNPLIVTREVKSSCPDLDFDILLFPLLDRWAN